MYLYWNEVPAGRVTVPLQEGFWAVYPTAESSIAFAAFQEPTWEIEPESLSVSPKLVALRPMKVTATEVTVVHGTPLDVLEAVRVEVASVVVEAPVQMPLPEREDVG
jgi:hypothetical protein